MPVLAAPSMRLAKHLAHAGVASRRAAEALIADGPRDGRRRGRARPRARRRRRRARSRSTASAVAARRHGARCTRCNKPRRRRLDRQRHPRPPDRRRPRARRRAGCTRSGRLDADTTGLILLTDDGDLANRLTHPRYEVPKTYRRAASAAGRSPTRALRALRDGRRARRRPDRAGATSRRLRPDVLELTIHEGRKRQVRRMCEAVGHPVTALERVALRPAAARRLCATARATGGSTRAPRSQRLRERRTAVASPPHAPVRPPRRHHRRRNEADAILAATEELMREIMERNELAPTTS